MKNFIKGLLYVSLITLIWVTIFRIYPDPPKTETYEPLTDVSYYSDDIKYNDSTTFRLAVTLDGKIYLELLRQENEGLIPDEGLKVYQVLDKNELFMLFTEFH